MSVGSAARFHYRLYGARVTSDSPFDFPLEESTREEMADRGAPLASVDFVEASEVEFRPYQELRESCDPGFLCRALAGGTTYLRWTGMYEFRVAADGRQVFYRPLDNCDRLVLQNFLFGQALAVALVRQGVEPLHAAVVCIDDRAVAFLGDCTFGKSTLMASFVKAGHKSLTDDLLIVGGAPGRPIALPGAGRIKLLPDSASAFIDDPARGTLLNSQTTKRMFPLASTARQPAGLPLRLLLVLPDPEERDRITGIELEPISRADMVTELLKSTFTSEILDCDRLERQFAFACRIASEVDGVRLRYPTGLHHLPAVRRTIVEQLRQAERATQG